MCVFSLHYVKQYFVIEISPNPILGPVPTYLCTHAENPQPLSGYNSEAGPTIYVRHDWDREANLERYSKGLQAIRYLKITLVDFKLILKGIVASSLIYCDHLVCFSLSSCNVWLAIFFVYAYVLFLKGCCWAKLTFFQLFNVSFSITGMAIWHSNYEKRQLAHFWMSWLSPRFCAESSRSDLGGLSNVTSQPDHHCNTSADIFLFIYFFLNVGKASPQES